MIYRLNHFANKILTTSQKHISNKKICNLSTFNLQNLLLETYMRSWKKFWTESNSGTALFKKEITGANEDNLFAFRLVSKNTKEGVNVSLQFIFKSNTSFEVRPIVSAPSETLRNKYTITINRVLNDISIEFNSHYSETQFIADLFDTLHSHNLSELTSKDALLMYKIYHNAIRFFPSFKKMSQQQQISLLQEGCLHALTLHNTKRDGHTYAMFTYEAISAANAANCFIATNPITRCQTLYSKVVQHSKGVILFGDYVYEVYGHQFHTSIHNSDLWNLLCDNSYSMFC